MYGTIYRIDIALIIYFHVINFLHAAKYITFFNNCSDMVVKQVTMGCTNCFWHINKQTSQILISIEVLCKACYFWISLNDRQQTDPSFLAGRLERIIVTQYLENVRHDTSGQLVALVEGHRNGRKTNKPQTNKDPLTGSLI